MDIPMDGPGPFHEGEIAVQERTGERPDAVRRGGMIVGALTPAARDFLSMQTSLALGTVDDQGRPWASLWFGAAGFVSAPSAEAVDVVKGLRLSPRGDPVESLLREGRELAMLAIDFTSRGRLRVNGVVTAANDVSLTMSVREAFPNCKKYINQRARAHGDELARGPARVATSGGRLGAPQRTTLGSVDTLFVASRHPKRGIDVSHRGGPPGFVRVLDDRTLRVPDYAGNGMFQTLGNFEVEPRAGVVFVDFEERRLLSMTGRVDVAYGWDEPEQPTGGTGRYWTFSVDEWVDLQMPFEAPDFMLIEASPHHPQMVLEGVAAGAGGA